MPCLISPASLWDEQFELYFGIIHVFVFGAHLDKPIVQSFSDRGIVDSAIVDFDLQFGAFVDVCTRILRTMAGPCKATWWGPPLQLDLFGKNTINLST